MLSPYNKYVRPTVLIRDVCKGLIAVLCDKSFHVDIALPFANYLLKTWIYVQRKKVSIHADFAMVWTIFAEEHIIYVTKSRTYTALGTSIFKRSVGLP